MIAVAPAAVITLTSPDGSKEDFFHIPGLNDPESNVTVAGTQYSASGAAICPSNQGNSFNNSDSKGSGPGGGTANTGGGTIVLPGQPCVKSVGTDASALMLRNRLKIRRAERDLTQAELADLMGTTRKSINAIETRRMVPSTLLALKIARAMNVPIEQIFSLTSAEE